MTMARARHPHIEGWVRRLNGDRLEIFLKVERCDGQPDRKIRASGPEAEMVELVEWFEEKTGLRVSSPVLPRRVAAPIPGQVSLDLTEIGELASEEKVTA
jgi:hypothetical protein